MIWSSSCREERCQYLMVFGFPAGSPSLAAQLQPRPGKGERHRVGGKRVQESRHVCPGDQRHDYEQSEWRFPYKQKTLTRAPYSCSLYVFTGESLHSWNRLPGLWEPSFSSAWAHTLCLQVIHTTRVVSIWIVIQLKSFEQWQSAVMDVKTRTKVNIQNISVNNFIWERQLAYLCGGFHR